jgi:hypothetical protein
MVEPSRRGGSVSTPSTGGNDGQWHDKLQTAIRAREMAKQLRRDKPKGFRPSVGKAQTG